MYEFTKQETRTKFKKTSYGKKTNKMLMISIICAIVLLLITIIFGLIGPNGADVYKIDEGLYNKIFKILEYAVEVVIVIVFYFYGIRDGAIEQYKIGLKK